MFIIKGLTEGITIAQSTARTSKAAWQIVDEYLDRDEIEEGDIHLDLPIGSRVSVPHSDFYLGTQGITVSDVLRNKEEGYNYVVVRIDEFEISFGTWDITCL